MKTSGQFHEAFTYSIRTFLRKVFDRKIVKYIHPLWLELGIIEIIGIQKASGER